MRIFLLLLFTIHLSACSKVDVSSYQGTEPPFNFYDYFAGETQGWGIVQDRNGLVTRQFSVRIDGTIKGSDTLVLDEDFSWRNGEKSQRIWTIQKTGMNTFQGTADDVVGKASGTTQGNALNWQYHLNINVDGSYWKIHLDDWMYLQPDNILINRTSMSKFGFHLGDITIVFSKKAS